jgi:murein DD-endopeptidase MepM/ murein hydrolase activator NlpD
MRFYPLYPSFPFNLNQGWGTLNPKDYSQFGFTRHNGVDMRIIETDNLVRAPFSGTVIRTGNQPSGGGIYLGLLSDEEFEFPTFTCSTPDGLIIVFPAATCRVLFDFLHLKSLSVQEGQHVSAKEILAIPDNTGFSTGPHCHYEILVNNKFVNPMTIQVPRGLQLTGRQLASFQKERNRIDELRALDPVTARVAQATQQ